MSSKYEEIAYDSDNMCSLTVCGKKCRGFSWDTEEDSEGSLPTSETEVRRRNGAEEVCLPASGPTSEEDNEKKPKKQRLTRDLLRRLQHKLREEEEGIGNM